MRVGIIQSNYIPWRGYFDFITNVDLFIIFDDIQYPQGRSWRNRNQVKTKSGLRWLTVPVKTKAHRLTVDQVLIGHTNKPWQDTHRVLLREALEASPYYEDMIKLWEEGISAGDLTVSQLNIRLIKLVCIYLNISTPIVMARDYIIAGVKTERLINLLKQVGGTTYLSGPVAQDYLDKESFYQHKIRLEYKTYDYLPYPQLWGDFVNNVTILDLIANIGPAAKDYLKSTTPNQVVVE